MAKYNFFDLLKLKPFPRLPNQEEIEEAVKKWERDAKLMANAANTPKDQKEELMRMQKTLPAQMLAFASDTKAQNEQRKQFRELHCAQLATLAGQMKKFGGKEIREDILARIARHIGLDYLDVIRVFREAGIQPLKREWVSLLPRANDLTIISDNLARLRDARAHGIGNIPVGMGSVTNLYEYLEVMLGPEQYLAVDLYDFRAIQRQFTNLAISHARGFEPFSIFRNIESIARTSFFDSEQSRARYDRYIKLQKCGLWTALEAICDLPDSVRLEPSFAKIWVDSIRRELWVSEEEARQIYERY